MNSLTEYLTFKTKTRRAFVNITPDIEKLVTKSGVKEVLMESSLKIEIDEEMVCGIEHHMNKQFTDALCIMLKCPAKSPRGRDIPMGECCKTSRGKEE